MSDHDTNWPLPEYNPGPRGHLHALGVISITAANLERSFEFLYLNEARKRNIPEEMAHIYYFSLNEEKRLAQTKALFDSQERDGTVTDLISNLVEYVRWCRETRNQLMHSELYPPAFGWDPEVLHLTKRASKQSPKSAYLRLSLVALRSIADRIREGIVRCAELNIYLRFRSRDETEIPKEYWPYLKLPPKLVIPEPLVLSSSP